MIPAVDILCARLGEKCYLPDFIDHPGRTDVSDLGRELVDLVMGEDPGVGTVPFGIITDGPEGKICTIRGTQKPDGSLSEWEANFRAFLVPCPYATDARWHRGWAGIFETLRVVPGKSLVAYLVDNRIEITHGHSLGGPLATATAAIAGQDLAVLFASPKPGDLGYRAFATSRIKQIRAYSNPDDQIPKEPLTIDEPWKIQDFEHVVGSLSLNPNSVTPAVPSDLWSAHNLTNYRRMLEAAAAA